MFNENKIRDGFLDGLNFNVKSLKVTSSNIIYIEGDAFTSDVFGQNLETIVIDNLNATNNLSFQLVKMSELPKLMSLTIANFLAFEPDTEALAVFKDSLKELTINAVRPWQISEQLGVADVKFKSLTKLDLRLNKLSSINGSMFSSVTETVETLYLQNSGIESIEEGTFDNFKALLSLDLSTNKLTTLPKGVFTNLFENENFKITLNSNEWACDCDLLELQKLMKNHAGAFTRPLTCNSPEEFENQAVAEVNLCPSTDETTIDFQPYLSTDVCENPDQCGTTIPIEIEHENCTVTGCVITCREVQEENLLLLIQELGEELEVRH